MDVITTDADTATVRVSKRELMILANAINEAREAVEEWEFSTRLGAEPAEAEELRGKLKTLLTQLREASA